MLVTVEDLKSTYGFSVSEKSKSEYEAYLLTAEEECLAYAGLEIGEFDEYLEGNGGRFYCLTHKPVLSIDSVTVDGTSVSYRYEKRASRLILGEQAKEGAEIIVSVTLGWEDGKAPSSLKSAIALTVQHLSKLQSAKLMGITSRTTDGGTETIEQSIPPLAVKGLLDRFKSVAM